MAWHVVMLSTGPRAEPGRRAGGEGLGEGRCAKVCVWGGGACGQGQSAGDDDHDWVAPLQYRLAIAPGTDWYYMR